MIVTFTDFGVAGPYLGQVRAVLHQQAPGVPVVDLFPDLPPFDIKAAAYLLPAYSQYLPPETACLCVVDPGVGGDRGALAVRADGRWYVGPDNGLLSVVIRRAERVSVFGLTWRPAHLSSTFHGRDLFAPVCARLARGEPPPGDPIDPAALVLPHWPEELSEVVYIDGYGNVITGVRAAQIPPGARIGIAGAVCDYRRTFEEAPPGVPFWYVNANGLVEIALAGGAAAAALAVGVGAKINVMHLS